MHCRQHVVSHFNIVRTTLNDNETTPLQVGNGNFAFNVDNTGMQVGQYQIFLSLKLINSLTDLLTIQYTVKLGMA
jgi:hypothetical protein